MASPGTNLPGTFLVCFRYSPAYLFILTPSFFGAIFGHNLDFFLLTKATSFGTVFVASFGVFFQPPKAFWPASHPPLRVPSLPSSTSTTSSSPTTTLLLHHHHHLHHPLSSRQLYLSSSRPLPGSPSSSNHSRIRLIDSQEGTQSSPFRPEQTRAQSITKGSNPLLCCPSPTRLLSRLS